MKKLIVLNHKMSLIYDDLYNYIERLNNIDTDNDFIVCPSNIYLEAFINNSDWSVGAQNINYNTDYKHTGEISTDQLKSLGIEYSLIGHYERVRDFNENPTIVNSKLIAALDANIFPILCFGEGIEDDYRESLPRMLDRYLKDINNIEFIIFAYEPIYAIGTGTLPTTEKIEEVTSFIGKYLEDKYHKKPVLLYGGSIDDSNIKDIINIPTIDGVLLGDISSDIRVVEKVVEEIN